MNLILVNHVVNNIILAGYSMTPREPFRVRAPGRICLFGEHSDYLGLDVITAAIELEIKIVATPRDDDTISVRYLDIGEEDEFPVDTLLAHRHKRDYLRSAFNVILDEMIVLENGWDVEVSGNIPMAGGLSSSSALSVASIMLATHMGGKELSPKEIVRLAYQAEVERFGESGGMMDHYASTFGEVIHVAMTSDLKVTKLPAALTGFVIGDSRLKKRDTVGDLIELKKIIEAGYEQIRKKLPDFNPRTTPINHVYELSRSKPDKSVKMAEATLRNRDLTAIALELLSKKNPDESEIGKLLTDHQEILRDDLMRSTTKLENMIDAAMNAGASGGKINGSGGGTMTAYAPGREEEVIDAINKSGGIAYKTGIGQGASLTILKE